MGAGGVGYLTEKKNTHFIPFLCPERQAVIFQLHKCPALGEKVTIKGLKIICIPPSLCLSRQTFLHMTILTLYPPILLSRTVIYPKQHDYIALVGSYV